MQERRTTIRINRFCRAQYCPAEEPLPRDGRLTTISERGAGLLVREPHSSGEQVTVGLSLPGEREPLTATGVVRWASPTPLKGSWYPMGLEWLPLEETTRHRLHQFLYRQAQTTPPSSAVGLTARPEALRRAPRPLLIGGAACGLLAALLIGAWVLLLHQQNQQLEMAVKRRNATIFRLKQQESRIQQELGSAKTHLAATSSEVARLDQLTQRLGGEAHRLNQDVEQFQESYVNVREEREELLQRLQDLTQERTLLARQSVAIPELHLAIREAIEAREAGRRFLPSAIPLFSGGTASAATSRPRKDLSLDGNRGYLLWKGQPTISGSSTLSIRVHDPEPLQ